MSLWRKTRSEMTGAYRSLRYDLGKPEADRIGPLPGAYGPDVTSTGMSTFGGLPLGAVAADPIRPPRRMLAATSFAVLAVAGATGSYFAVVNGLGALLGVERPEPYPLAVTAPQGVAANSGLGAGIAQRAADSAPIPAGTVTVTAFPGTAGGSTVPPATVPATPTAVPTTAAPVPPVTVTPPTTGTPGPGATDCCAAPPVPTPTNPSGTGEPPAPGGPSGPGLPVPSATRSPTPSQTPSPVASGSTSAVAETSPAPVRESATSRHALLRKH